MQVGRGRVGSKRVVISNKEIAVIFILHFDKILQCPEIITEVKVSCGPDAADNCIHNNVWVKKIRTFIAESPVQKYCENL
jgi:hypothetical protein